MTEGEPVFDFEMHPAVYRVLRQFRVGHLSNPEHRELVGWYVDQAERLARLAPHSPDTTHALRSLMTAKDDALRALIFRD